MEESAMSCGSMNVKAEDAVKWFDDWELTPETANQVLKNYSEFLCRMTGGKLSKIGYSVPFMEETANDYQELNCGMEWIDVNDRMPAEKHSIFWPWRNSSKWSKAMWAEQSDKVLVTICFKDGTRVVTTGETHDGEWYTTVSRTLDPVVTHWMQMPEPAE